VNETAGIFWVFSPLFEVMLEVESGAIRVGCNHVSGALIQVIVDVT
jgi:hypothetical protein